MKEEEKLNPGKMYTVKKGKHFSYPRVLKFKKNTPEIHWAVQFNHDCNYILKEENGARSIDQKDWNKLCGVFFSTLNTRKEAAMIGWRYNPDTDLIELAPYYHIEGGRDMFPPLLSVCRETEVQICLLIDRERKLYKWRLNYNNDIYFHEMSFSHNKKRLSFINFYFGGNKPAPQEVSCKMKMEFI